MFRLAMLDICILWISILLGNYYIQAQHVDYQELQKTTGCGSTIDCALAAARLVWNSTASEENKASGEDHGSLEEYVAKSKHPSTEYNPNLADARDIFRRFFKTPESDIFNENARRSLEEYAAKSQLPSTVYFPDLGDARDISRRFYESPISDIFKDDPNIIRVTVKIPVDDYEPGINTYRYRRREMKFRLAGFGLLMGGFYLFICGLRKCFSKNTEFKGSSEDSSGTFIVIIPKSENDPKP